MSYQWRVILLPLYNHSGDYADYQDPEYYYFDTVKEALEFYEKKSEERSKYGQKLYYCVPPCSCEVII